MPSPESPKNSFAEKNFMILGLGSNLGDRAAHLKAALAALQQHFTWQAQSKIYASAAVDYVAQPPFYNLVVQYALPRCPPREALQTCLQVEQTLGRQRTIPKGPRTIDIDILFWSTEQIRLPDLQVPHPRCWQRSFVYFPLQELPAAQVLAAHFGQAWQQAQHDLKIQDLKLVEP
jgi:2-amino-4-hydroxy-6-hydroxymethyldihydropteridine diphosphokinase